jgi:outer membrane receptor protein involved in Fe transport
MKNFHPTFSYFIIFLLFTNVLYAQQFPVTGKIIDGEKGFPLEFSTVSQLHLADSTLINGVAADLNGEFELMAASGTYIFRFDYLGYTTVFREVTIADAPVNLRNIRLNADGQQLDEVTIVAASRLFQTDIDKRTYNVENNVLAQGASASELLNTLPSIQMDEEGGITMRGSGNVLIYINGRPTNMTSEEMENVLAQFPANSIKEVELITNPSSRYDAQGVGGIINLILKKDQRMGFNGSVNASVGTRDKYQGGVNLNYATGDVNFYGSYNYQFRSLFEESESLRRTTDPTVSPLLDQDFDTQNENQSHLLRAGMDYNITENTTWGVYGQLNRSSRDRLRIYNQRHLNQNAQLDSLFIRTLNEDQFSRNIEVGTTLDIQLDTLGQSVYVSASYANNTQERTEFFDQRFFDSSGTEVPENFQDQIYGRPQDAELWIAQLDYTKPLNKNARLEAGLKSTLSYYQPAQTFDQLDLNTGIYVQNDTIANRFPFDEEVHAAYAIYRNTLGKVGFQLGARAEWTNTEGFDENSQTTYSNAYFDVFPSAYLTYALSENDEIILNYSRRINRPRWVQLAPFYNAQDLLNTRLGNPFLKPAYTDSYELGYNRDWEKILLSGTLYHRRTSDAMTRIIGFLPNNAAVQLWDNANYRRDTGFELINQFRFLSTLDATLTGNLFYSEINGRNIRENYFNSNFSWTLNLLTNWALPDVATFQLMADYRGPIALPQGKIDPMYGVNIGARRDLFNRRATVSVNVSDVFNTRRFKIQTDDTVFSQTRRFNRESRIATVAFTWRFGGFREQERVQRERYSDDPF